MVLKINHQQKTIGDSNFEIKLVRKILKIILNKKDRAGLFRSLCLFWLHFQRIFFQ